MNFLAPVLVQRFYIIQNGEEELEAIYDGDAHYISRRPHGGSLHTRARCWAGRLLGLRGGFARDDGPPQPGTAADLAAAAASKNETLMRGRQQGTGFCNYVMLYSTTKGEKVWAKIPLLDVPYI